MKYMGGRRASSAFLMRDSLKIHREFIVMDDEK